jgi:hypothetical protein
MELQSTTSNSVTDALCEDAIPSVVSIFQTKYGFIGQVCAEPIHFMNSFKLWYLAFVAGTEP